MAVPLTEQEIRQIVKQEIQSSQAHNRFQLTGIPRHVHNNIDSPFVFQPTITYIGVLLVVGTTVVPEAAFPQGWTATYSTTGLYLITHNLNTNYYSATANTLTPTPGTAVSLELNPNVLNIEVFNTTTAAAADADVCFTLTLVNNRSTTPPIYSA